MWQGVFFLKDCRESARTDGKSIQIFSSEMNLISRMLFLVLAHGTLLPCVAEDSSLHSAHYRKAECQALRDAIKSDNLPEVQRLMAYASSLCPPSERRGVQFSDAQKRAAVLQYAASVNACNTISWLLQQKTPSDDTQWCAYNHHANDGRTALHVAALHAQVEAVKLLLDAGANPNAADKDGNTPLMLAASGAAGNDEREWQTIDCLLRAGADPARRNSEGKTATEISKKTRIDRTLCFCGVLDKWGKITVHGVTYQDVDGMLMRQFLLCGDCEQVEGCLKRGDDVNCKYEYGETALLLAMRRGDADMVRLLLRYGATWPTAKDAQYLMLYAAVLSGNPELLALLPFYIEPDDDTSRWESPLVVALRGRCGPAMTAALIQSEAFGFACALNPERGNLALRYARMSGDKTSATILRAHIESDWSIMDDILKDNDVEGLRELLATRCFFALDRRIHGGYTPLQAAVRAGQTEIVELLRAAGADEKAIEATQGKAPTLIIDDYEEFAARVEKAVEQGNADFFLSLKRGINRCAGPVYCKASAYDPGPAKGRYYLAPPLRHAAAAGKADLVRALLACGADLDACDVFSRTAIEYAAANGHVECVRLLLNAGAFDYRDALYVAALCGQHAVVDYLLSRGVQPGLAPEWALMSDNPHPGLLALRKPDVDVALSLAVELDHPEAVKRLVAMGANVNRPNFFPLHTTFVADMVRALAECGADLNRRNADGLTPLENARKQNYTLAAEALEKLTQATQP